MMNAFDPVEVFYSEGSVGLRASLLDMESSEIKLLLAKYTTIPRKEYTRLNDSGLLTGLLVRSVKRRAYHGQAFGDYKLPY